MFGKLKEFFSEETSFKTEAENFVNVWSVKRGIAKPTAEEWVAITEQAQADNFNGEMTVVDNKFEYKTDQVFESPKEEFEWKAELFLKINAVKQGFTEVKNFKKWFENFTTTDEWRAIMSEAEADKYEGKMGINKDGTAFTYRNSKDIAWSGGGGGGILV
jgi:hypothetical protein